MNKYFITAIFSGVLSAFSQILLKKGSAINRKTIWEEYFNAYVIAGYAIMVICMLLTVVAFAGIPFKYAGVLESLGYIYIMLFSRLLLNEKITGKKAIGNIVIVTGVMIFSMGK